MLVFLLISTYSSAIVDNVPVYEFLSNKQKIHYSYQYKDTQGLKITVSALNGDPDVYVKVNKQADTHQFDFKGAGIGGEVLNISHQQLMEICDTDCNLDIMIHGFRPGEFWIILYLKSKPFLEIPNDVPILDQSNTKQQFRAIISHKQDLKLDIETLTGDIQLFFSIYDEHDDIQSINPENAQYSTYTSNLPLHIQNDKESVQRYCKSVKCQIIIGAICFNQTGDCKYTIQVQQNQIQTIQVGYPVEGQVQLGQYNYYKFYNEQILTNIYFLLTAQSGSDPDICVALNRKCTMNDYDWKSDTYQGDTLIITKDDPLFEGGGMMGSFIVGIYGATNAFYTLVVKTDIRWPVRLLNGVAVNGETQDVDYYFFENQLDSEVEIKFTNIYGEAQIRVSTQDLLTEEIEQMLPTKDVFIWQSKSSGIIIDSNDSNYCTNCNYIIAVFSYSCQYRISAQNKYYLTQLQQGVPIFGLVNQREWDYYTIQLTDTQNLQIDLVVYTGDSDLFVSTEPVVSEDNYNWSSASKQNEHIDITVNDKNFKIGSYYIGIRGFTTSSYQILVSFPDSIIYLTNGLEQTFVLPAKYNSGIYLSYKTREYTQFTCEITSYVYNVQPLVYLNTAKGAKTPNPSPASSEFSYGEKEYDPILNKLVVKGASDKAGDNIFGIFSNQSSVPISVLCFDRQMPIQLSLGSYHYGVLEYYGDNQSFVLHSTPGLKIQVQVSSCSGDVETYINRDEFFKPVNSPEVIADYSNEYQEVMQIIKPEGLFYIHVRAIKRSVVLHKMRFQIIIQAQTQQTAQALVAGGDGNIDYANKGNKIQLQWEAIPYDSFISYTAYFADQLYDEMWTQCGLTNLMQNGFADVITNLEQNSPYTRLTDWNYVNIVGKVLHDFPHNTLYATYTPTNIRNKKTDGYNDTSSPLPWILVTLLIIIVIGGSIVGYKKYKRDRRNTNYIEFRDL